MPAVPRIEPTASDDRSRIRQSGRKTKTPNAPISRFELHSTAGSLRGREKTVGRNSGIAPKIARRELRAHPASRLIEPNESPMMIAYATAPTSVLNVTIAAGSADVDVPKTDAHVSLYVPAPASAPTRPITENE